MKRILILSIFCFGLGGCAYRKQVWHTRAEVCKMQVRKLDSQPVIADSIKGYFGIVANHDRYHVVNAKLVGPEKFSITLPRAGRDGPANRSFYLLPGDYKIFFTAENGDTASSVFSSGIEIKEYLGISVHWYAWYGSEY